MIENRKNIERNRIDDAGDKMEKMFALERREKILQKLHEKQRITVKELSDEISVSEATLRTDLTKLEQEGLLKRTHGGAIPVDAADGDHSFSTREKKNKNEKTVIAKKALEFVSEGQCIMLDASSTALELARLLKQTSMRLTVVTNGIQTALELNEHPDITVILLGGIVKRGSLALEGNLGVNILKEINIDLLFTSANGFSLSSGLTDFSVYEVELKKAMVEAADQTIALLDYSKMFKNSIASFASPAQIDMVITDYELAETERDALSLHNIQAVMVSK